MTKQPQKANFFINS